MSAKEVLTDPREIRKLLNDIGNARWPIKRVDGAEDYSGLPASTMLIRTVTDRALYAGYSGEDTMTLLAYHALLAHEQLHDVVLQFYNTHPNIRMPLAGEQQT